MTLDPKNRFELVKKITKYIDENYTWEDQNGIPHYEVEQIKILLSNFEIFCPKNYFESRYLLNAEGKNIIELAEYLLKEEGLGNLFHDKYAIEILASEEGFSNLNLYLRECFECIKADRKIATAILLRACVEIFIDLGGFNKNQKEISKKLTLGTSINNLIPLMEKDEAFAMFNKNNKQNELKQFLEGIKDFGNDAAHLNGKNAKDFIEKFDNKELLKLFCILIEHSILKDGIRKKNEMDVENMIKSIDFNMKEKAILQNTTSDSEISSDDEIPF
ncbi:MAG: DUF4145 domain-containing protein [Rickettsiales bacterium]|nr:DUF4145 domain-containing protein [Rickettsiales bacterium]